MRIDLAAFPQRLGRRFPNPTTICAAAGMLSAVLMVGYVVLFGSGQSVAETEVRAKTVAITGPVFTPVASTPPVMVRRDGVFLPSIGADAPLPLREDGAALTRAVQTALKRADCYHGPINGAWTNRTSAAMEKFTARVNARLPVHKPDPVLLALLETHDKVSCRADSALPSAVRMGETPSGHPVSISTPIAVRPTIGREAALPPSVASAISEGEDPPMDGSNAASKADVEAPMSAGTAMTRGGGALAEEKPAVAPASIVRAKRSAKRDRPQRAARKMRRQPSLSRSVSQGFRSIQRAMDRLF